MQATSTRPAANDGDSANALPMPHAKPGICAKNECCCEAKIHKRLQTRTQNTYHSVTAHKSQSHCPRTLRNTLKVGRSQRDAHAKHEHADLSGEGARRNAKEGRWAIQGRPCREQGPDGKEIAKCARVLAQFDH